MGVYDNLRLLPEESIAVQGTPGRVIPAAQTAQPATAMNTGTPKAPTQTGMNTGPRENQQPTTPGGQLADILGPTGMNRSGVGSTPEAFINSLMSQIFSPTNQLTQDAMKGTFGSIPSGTASGVNDYSPLSQLLKILGGMGGQNPNLNPLFALLLGGLRNG